MSLVTDPSAPEVAVGDYLCSDHELFWVAEVTDSRTVVEDCTTCELLEVDAAFLNDLRPVRQSKALEEVSPN